jgi:hypothetical protein
MGRVNPYAFARLRAEYATESRLCVNYPVSRHFLLPNLKRQRLRVLQRTTVSFAARTGKYLAGQIQLLSFKVLPGDVRQLRRRLQFGISIPHLVVQVAHVLFDVVQ